MAKLGVVIVARLLNLALQGLVGTLRGALRSYPISLGFARLPKVSGYGLELSH